MSTPLGEIRCRKLWHVTAAWHYFVHVSTSSESLAEAVGSILSFLRRSNVNGALSTKRIVWATQLRVIGLQGLGGEEGILFDALNYHVRCSGPAGWHFTAVRRKSRKFGPGNTTSAYGEPDDSWQRVLRDVRLGEKPAWFGTPLRELARSGSMAPGFRFPQPESFLVLPADARQHRQLSVTKQRDQRDRIGSAMWEPKELSDRLWTTLGMNQQKLPRHLLPAKTAKL